MGIVLALLTAIAAGPTAAPELPGAILRGPAKSLAATCVESTAELAGTHGFAWGLPDHAVARLPVRRMAACLSAVVRPEARPGARRLARLATGRPRTVLSIARLAGWCDGDAAGCAIDRCAAVPEPEGRLACLLRLAPAAAGRARARDLAAVARVRLAPDDFETLAAARAVFADLASEGYPAALANLALVEYRLTNLSAAYDAAVAGAAYGIPAAQALRAYLEVEGFGPRWDLATALHLARSAERAGSADGGAVLSLDVSYLFSPHHWEGLQEAMRAKGLHDGPVDGHFRGAWQDALSAYAADAGLPDGVTLPLLEALGILDGLADTIRPQRVLRRY